jgi:outer membrane protein OmpA-like peptidoglycan-associated protein
MQRILVIFLFCLIVPVSAQEPVLLTMAMAGPYSLIERSDWRRYDNGKYTGLTHREVRAFISPQANSATAFSYQGNFFVLEETLRDMRQSAQLVDAVVPVNFQISSDGRLHVDNDKGFPSLRGFPTFPDKTVLPGSKWTAPGDRAVDPLNSGKPVIVPFVAEYEYRGIEDYRDVPVHRITARYGARYQQEFKLQGAYKVDILLRVEDGLPVLMRNDLDETYTIDGKTIRFLGFTLTFGQGTVPLNRKQVITTIEQVLLPLPSPALPAVEDTIPDIPAMVTETEPEYPAIPADFGPDIEVTTVPEGIKLMLHIQFMPDSDQFVPEERLRIDGIAAALQQIPERTFLVEGHTSEVGYSNGIELSERRAKHMVDELVGRGISADRFIYKGWGSTKPVASNATMAGRTRNRRVEITILE